MYAVYGDIHGDMESLERVLGYLESRRDITHHFFTGDVFGLPPNHELNLYKGSHPLLSGSNKKMLHTQTLREQGDQLKDFEERLSSHPQIKERFSFVGGNFDPHHVPDLSEVDIHHQARSIDGKRAYGHGGSYYEPTSVSWLLHPFSWAYFLKQDRKDEMTRLLQAEQLDIILSHSPIKEYVAHFLEKQDQATLLYLGGHTHVQQFKAIEHDTPEKTVYLLRPGAAGITLHGGTGEPLPKTLMVYDPTNPEECQLLTLEEETIREETLTPERVPLKQYLDQQAKWDLKP
jgi:predicted phosphodiesterase